MKHCDIAYFHRFTKRFCKYCFDGEVVKKFLITLDNLQTNFHTSLNQCKISFSSTNLDFFKKEYKSEKAFQIFLYHFICRERCLFVCLLHIYSCKFRTKGSLWHTTINKTAHIKWNKNLKVTVITKTKILTLGERRMKMVPSAYSHKGKTPAPWEPQAWLHNQILKALQEIKMDGGIQGEGCSI